MRYFLALAHERFPPDDLLRQAVEGEEAGFDGVCCSDHFQPWWLPGQPAPAESGMAWVWLGAAAQVTKRVQVGTAVTGVVGRYHPALVAQAFATLEVMNPGRVFIGVGSSEAMNELPLGVEWPEPAEQLERLEEALEIIGRLLDGERLDFEGRHFRTKSAFLYTRPERRVPVYVSAFQEGAARAAGRLGDGLWTLGDPKTAPGLVSAYRDAAEDAGREAGEVLIHVPFSWAETDDAALEGCREWKATLVDEYYTDPWDDPGAMQAHAVETVSDAELKAGMLVSADPAEHVARIKALEKLGATTIVLMNVSGADPHRAISLYRDHVLPELRS